MEKVELKVVGMSCGHCKQMIEGSVGSLSGVENVVVDVAKSEVAIEFNSHVVSLDKIKETIDDQGYVVG